MTMPYQPQQQQQSNGMDQMIRMLSAISDLQSRKKEIDLRQQQLDESRQEFARSMGAQEKSDQMKYMVEFAKLAENTAAEDTKTRGELYTAAQKAGLPLEMADAIRNTQQSLQSMVAAKARTGMAALNPQDVAGVASGVGDRSQQAQTALMQVVYNAIKQDPKMAAALANQISGKATQDYQGRMATVAEQNARTGEQAVTLEDLGRRAGFAVDLLRNATQQSGKAMQEQLTSARLMISMLGQYKGAKGNDKVRMAEMFDQMSQQYHWGLKLEGDGSQALQTLQDMVQFGQQIPGASSPMGQQQGQPQNPISYFTNPQQPQSPWNFNAPAQRP